jgi:hypothetical protein
LPFVFRFGGSLLLLLLLLLMMMMFDFSRMPLEASRY